MKTSLRNAAAVLVGLLCLSSARADYCDNTWNGAVRAGNAYKSLKPATSSAEARITAAREAYDAWIKASSNCSGANSTNAFYNAGVYLEATYTEYCVSTRSSNQIRMRSAVDKLGSSMEGGSKPRIFGDASTVVNEANAVISSLQEALDKSMAHGSRTIRCDDDDRRHLSSIKEGAQEMRKAARCLMAVSVAGAKRERMGPFVADLTKPGSWEQLDSEIAGALRVQDEGMQECDNDSRREVESDRATLRKLRYVAGCSAWGDRALQRIENAKQHTQANRHAEAETAWESTRQAADTALSHCRQHKDADKGRITALELLQDVAKTSHDLALTRKNTQLCAGYRQSAHEARTFAQTHAEAGRHADAAAANQRAVEQLVAARGVCAGGALQAASQEEQSARGALQGSGCDRDFTAAKKATEAWKAALLDGGAAVVLRQIGAESAWKDTEANCAGERKLQATAARAAIGLRAAASIAEATFRDCPDCPEMVPIPAGSFEMGSNNGDSDEKPVHTVRIAKPFALAKTEVTQGQWRAVMGSNPSDFKDCGDDCPVETVNWNDAQEYVRKLSQKTGKTYRLPSEAEWEYACRAGGTHTWCGSDSVDSVAWYTSNSGNKTHSVAGKQANAWGLYDMSGNVWEWAEDCSHDNYNGAPNDGSAWTSGECVRRVVRGGSWNDVPGNLRAAHRTGSYAANRFGSYGFRPARTLP